MKKLINLVRRLGGFPIIHESLLSLHGKFDSQLRREAQEDNNPKAPAGFIRQRILVSEMFLKGDGIEVGAFASPLPVAADVHVKYVDKYDLDALDASHTIAGLTLKDFGVDLASVVRPDIVDDGECLSKVGDYSQDFVIANHVFEHFEDPIKGFKNMLRVLKHGGILYLSLPDMRHSFDQVRQPTSFSHLLKDYEEGPAGSRESAYAEFAKIFAAHGMDKGFFERRSGQKLTEFEASLSRELDKANYSIHFHAWTMDGMLDMFLKIKSIFKLAFETRLIMKNNDEVIFIFQKTVPHVDYRVH